MHSGSLFISRLTIPSPSSNLPALPINTPPVPPDTQRRRQERAGPASTNATPADTAPAHQATFGTVSAVNTIETVTRTTQTSTQMFNRSRHSEFHGSSLSSVGGDDRRSSVVYNYSIGSISLSNVANTEVIIYFGQELGTGNEGSQSAVRVVSRRRDDEIPSERRVARSTNGEFVPIDC
ncbi:hypothetical protein D9758_014843 [Tetrapyrgos nigripes]|uniref:Uncharacterized protein n=1 Tax=Tetrapyrgos nigripes TaxID=182062 RepID=A0A8H5CTB3_9AGAR|nr:hypothetical protein D9758_014843 [Tetrapyrgos nigripes]